MLNERSSDFRAHVFDRTLEFQTSYRWKGWWDDIRTEISIRLGSEIYAEDGAVRGTRFADRVVLGDRLEAIDTGAGNDTIYAISGGTSFSTPIVAGTGLDRFVLADGDPDAVEITELTYVVGDRISDQFVLVGFDAASRFNWLGDSLLEVLDTDGDVLLVTFVDQKGDTADGRGTTDFILFDGTAPLPASVPLVIAEDIEGISLAGTWRSDTILYNAETTKVSGGLGEDVISGFEARSADSAIEIFGGRGSDLILLPTAGAATAYGGAADDQIVLDSTNAKPGDSAAARTEFFGGGGRDEISVLGAQGSHEAYGGSGKDHLSLAANPDQSSALRDAGAIEFAFFGDRGDDVIEADFRFLSETAKVAGLIDGGTGDDIVALDMRGSNAAMDMTTRLESGDDTLIIRVDGATGGPTGKCFVALEDERNSLTLVLPDFGDEVEIFDRADGAVIFRDVDTGVSFGCYFCDVDDLSAADLAESENFITDFELILV
ncbi:MAG: hypothetical protein AAGD12_18200 [Pseudomonadota bacterium]